MSVQNVILWAALAVVTGIVVSGSFYFEMMKRRNDKVYRFRIDYLNRHGPNALEADLPSYEHMYARWWVLDLNKFVKKASS